LKLTAQLAGNRLLSRPDNHLRAAKHGDHFVGVAMSNDSIPDVRIASHMHRLRRTLDDPFPRGANEVALQLDCGEAGGSLRQVRKASVSARRIGKRDDCASVEIAIRGEERFAHGQLGSEGTVVDIGDDNADFAASLTPSLRAHSFGFSPISHARFSIHW
jgi:hypothetical protein